VQAPPHLFEQNEVSGARTTRSDTCHCLKIIRVFRAKFTGGIFIAVGDMDHDSWADVIVSLGAGLAVTVIVVREKTQAVIESVTADNIAFKGGVTVAAVDVDGLADFVVDAGKGQAVHVRVVSGKDLSSPLADLPADVP
jgi:hypothetical protein